MSKPRPVLGDATIYVLANLACAGIPFLLLPILTRALTPEDYGRVAMFSVTVSFLNVLIGVNVHGAINVRYFQIDRDDFPRYVLTCLSILAVTTLLAVAATALALPWLAALTQLPPLWLLIAVAVSGCQFIVQIQLAVWQASRQPIAYGALRFGQASLDAALSLLLVLALGASWQGRLGGISLASCLVAVVAWWRLKRGGWLRPPASLSHARDALAFGLPLVPHALGGLLVSVVDRIMVSQMVSIAGTGVYTAALQIGMVLGILAEAFNRAYSPWLLDHLRHADPARDVKIVRYTYLYFVTIILIATALSLCAPFIMKLLIGDKFSQALPLIPYIVFAYAFTGMYYMVTSYVFFAGRTGVLASLTLGSGLLNVYLTYVLLQRHGIVGAAQSFMVAQALLFLGTWWVSHQCRPMPWSGAFTFKARDA